MSVPDRRHQDYFDSFSRSHRLLVFPFPEETQRGASLVISMIETFNILREANFSFSQRTPPN